MGLKYFCAYHSMLGGTRKLSDAECGRLFRALLRYSSGEDVELINLQGREEVLFDVYSQQIDRDRITYEEKCEKNKANASGRKRSQANASDGSQDKEKRKEKEEEEGKGKEETTATTLPTFQKKIDDNYKHSNRARAAAAQIVVDEIISSGLLPSQDGSLFDRVFEGLVNGLTPEQIYECAREATYPGEYVPLMMWKSGGRWREANGLS